MNEYLSPTKAPQTLAQACGLRASESLVYPDDVRRFGAYRKGMTSADFSALLGFSATCYGQMCSGSRPITVQLLRRYTRSIAEHFAGNWCWRVLVAGLYFRRQQWLVGQAHSLEHQAQAYVGILAFSMDDAGEGPSPSSETDNLPPTVLPHHLPFIDAVDHHPEAPPPPVGPPEGTIYNGSVYHPYPEPRGPINGWWEDRAPSMGHEIMDAPAQPAPVGSASPQGEAPASESSDAGDIQPGADR